ncbi:hypothetical protein R1sor_002971 [Riccia sorocarpa]|uniref:Carrier domain-containing protein n=1 Tax=Riccia sorocarpa TaxID=122646 RepID=A0ABD3H6E3_9MARC
MEYGSHRTVVSLLQKVCRENGKDVALVGTKDTSLTYVEMWRRVQAFSAHLVQTVGVKPGQNVGLCLDRCFDHIVAVLAVLNAGAVYVPMDPELPQQHLAYMIKDAQLQFILTQRRYSLDLENIMCHFSGTSSTLLILDGLIDQLTRGFKVKEESELEFHGVPEPQPEDLAYIIYTSGSTGEPKGVMVPHRGLLGLSVVVAQTWELGKPWPESRMLQFASPCFDASISEIFPTFCRGATLVLGSREELLPGHKLADFMRSQRVTAVILPPSVMATLNDFSASLPLLRTIIAGGEACSLALARKWSIPGRKFINAYGPTECTVITTMHVFDPVCYDLSTVSLGEPLLGWQVHLLDDRLQPVQDGEVGEIYISGVGLSQGYYKKPDVTSKYFLSHPTVGTYLYRSGDLGVRQGPKKLLEFVGRVDNQIKINGFRVELGAVEQTLCEHPFVEYAAVKAVEVNQDSSNHMLVAYVVPTVKEAATDNLCSEFLNYFLLDRLPKYMVPVIYVRMDALPLTANRGKVDRKALPHHSTLPNLSASSQEISASGPDVEFKAEDGLNGIISKCCAIFQKVLNLGSGQVKTDSNYFHLGGSSLWVAKLVYEVQAAFNVELLSWQIYRHPTPQQLAFCISQMQKPLAGPYSSSRVQEVHAEDLLKEAYSLEKTLHPVGSPKTSSKVALVTGATGFLGVFLLENLLLESSLEVIYCLIRGTSSSHARERLQATREKYGLQTKSLMESSVKLVILAGDVEDSKLGLSMESYAQLSDHVDLIYHVAASTNYIRPYAEIRQPNVEGTRNILHFAAAGNRIKILHYVSTIGLFGTLSGFTRNTLHENFDIEQCLSFFSQGETGYTTSKWVAEIMVLDYKSRGFPVSIYRPGFIEAHSTTGVANTDDLLCRYIKGCIQMGAYPKLPGKFWEPIPVNFAAAAISYISLKEKPGQIYNLIPDREREMDNQGIFQCLAEDHQCILKELSVRHWLDALSKVPPSNALYPLRAYLSEKIHENRYTPLEIPTAKFGFENTKSALQFLNIEVPGFDRILLQKYGHQGGPLSMKLNALL